MAVQTRKERIDIRVTKEEKQLIEKAAAESRLSISSYLISLAVKQAKIDLVKNKTIYLSDEEMLRFYEIINHPSELTEYQKKLLDEIDFDEKLDL